MPDWVKVCKTSEIGEGAMKEFSVGGRSVAVAKVGEEFFAFDNLCTHAECALSGGTLNDHVVTCWCHGSEFDVRTGAVRTPPAEKPLDVFPVKIEGEELFVAV